MNKRLRLRIIEIFGSQADFAEHVEADESLVSRVINDRKKLKLEMQKKWAVVLRCHLDDIFESSNRL